MLKLFSNYLLAPETEKPDSGGLSVEDTIEFLTNEDNDEVPIKLEDKDKKEVKEEEEKEEEKDELDEVEEELGEPTDEQLELVTPVRRKEILTKYPKLFKDFPYLEKAYYREQQFTELLPTIDDARSAVEAKNTLDHLESDLMNGDTEKLLIAAKQENPNAFNKIVDNYLMTLAKVDEKAYHHVLGNTIKHTIIAMVKEGRRQNNETLESAATILNQFVFGNSEFTPPSNLTKDEPDKKDNGIDRERELFIRERFESVQEDLNNKVNNTIKATIEGNIDPKGSMSDYIKKNASREAIESLNDLLEKDARLKTVLDKLWDASRKENFSKTSLDKIRSTYLSRAKTLLPAVIKTARNEALRGLGKRVRDDDNEPEVKEESSSKQRKSTSPSNSGRKEVPKNMTTLDYLMQD